MRDILETLEAWMSSGQGIALATVVSTWGSSPRQVGSKMAVHLDGSMVGSVSGGCVEGAVAEIAIQVIQGEPPQLLHFGVSDDNAWDVGLACGGSIEIFVQSLNPEILTAAASLIHKEQTFGILTCIEGPEAALGQQLLVDFKGEPITGNYDLHKRQNPENLRAALSTGESGRLQPDPSSGRGFFLDVISAPKKLVLIGGVHISIALAKMAKELGYKTIVVDPRRLFASDERFPAVDRLLRSWPQEAFEQIELDHDTAIAVLTHDPKIDDPAILGALEHPVFYIGVLGSRKTHAKRIERLKHAGCTDKQLERLHAPIGLHISAQSPEEIALSIMAEITATRHGLAISA